MALPQRKPTRMKGYDYSQNGAYFVTICTHNRRHLFASVQNDFTDSPTIVNDLDRPITFGNNVDHSLTVGNGLDRSAPIENNLDPSFIVGNGLDRSAILLNAFGKIAESELRNIPKHFSEVLVDHYVVMPNHIHAILFIGDNDCDAEQSRPAERSRPFPTVSTVVGLYKSGTARLIHAIAPQQDVWQKSFYDHIIRNEQDYAEIWNYIDTNPIRWTQDRFYL